MPRAREFTHGRQRVQSAHCEQHGPSLVLPLVAASRCGSLGLGRACPPRHHRGPEIGHTWIVQIHLSRLVCHTMQVILSCNQHTTRDAVNKSTCTAAPGHDCWLDRDQQRTAVFCHAEAANAHSCAHGNGCGAAWGCGGRNLLAQLPRTPRGKVPTTDGQSNTLPAPSTTPRNSPGPMPTPPWHPRLLTGKETRRRHCRPAAAPPLTRALHVRARARRDEKRKR